MRVIVAIAFSLIVVVTVLWSFELTMRARDDERYPPPGHFVDRDGRALHVHCAGVSDGVTVMLEAGAGASSLDWEAVATELAMQGRVCRYDRAGHGWSDRGPRPRTIEAIVDDLHFVIGEEARSDQIVLAGHSFGGLIAQAYARQHSDRLLGLVLVDAVDAEFIRLYAEQSKSGARTMRLGSVITHIGIPRLLGLAPAPKSAPDHIQQAMKARVIRPANIATVADESMSVDANVQHLQTLGPLRDSLLVTVLSRQTDSTDAFERDWEATQLRLGRLTEKTKHVRSSSSDHQLPFTDTGLVVGEIMLLADRDRDETRSLMTP